MAYNTSRSILLGRWSLVAVLGVIAAGLVVNLALAVASDQPTPAGAGDKARVFVTAGQISRDTYGLYLVDFEKKTICVYQIRPKSRDNKLQLMAARTYAFDVQLDELNTSPAPREIKKMVEKHKRLKSKE